MDSPDSENQTMSALRLLWPRPRHAKSSVHWLELPAELPVLCIPIEAEAERRLFDAARRALEPIGVAVTADPRTAPTGPRLHLRRAPGGAPEAYQLTVDDQRIVVEGADERGLYWGLQTLAQWARAAHFPEPPPMRRLRTIEVTDAPDLTERGVMLDVSRNRVPRLDSLFTLVDRLSSLKINQLQLYTEHTFAYRGHESVWEGWSPITPDEIRRLDAHCRNRHIELVPNQNSFGHLHRWLVHEPYRRLAECPDGIEHPFSEEREPFSLCPLDPGSLRLLEELFDQLLPNFTSRRFNVGFDETLDLGQGRSAAACAERGRTTVYLDFLRQVHRLVERRGFRMLFWGDIILEEPERVVDLPRDIVALDWGYEAGHPFDDEAKRFAGAQRDFWVCPGTSSWNSLTGRNRNALDNLESAARAARAHGASGYLVTDWGDFGHLQPPSVSYPGYTVGAGRAWSVDADPEPLDELVAFHFLHSECADGHEARQIARTALGLGDLYRHTGAKWHNGSALFFLLLFSGQSLEQRRFAGLDERSLEACRERLAESLSELPRAPLPARELRWAARLLDIGARLGISRLRAGRGTPAAELPAPDRKGLTDALAESAESLEPLWLERSRPGGLEPSRERIRSWRSHLLPD